MNPIRSRVQPALRGAYEQVSADLVGTEPVVRRRPLQSVGDVALVELPRAHHGADDEQQQDQHEADRSDDRHAVVAESFPRQPTERLWGLGESFDFAGGEHRHVVFVPLGVEVLGIQVLLVEGALGHDDPQSNRIRGSSTPYMMSATRLKKTVINPVNSTMPRIR